MRPKILFLNCHGNKKKYKNVTHFCFESVSEAGLMQKFSEEKFYNLLRNIKSEVKLIVLSACHSSNLGKLLFEAGIPVVVSIHTSVRILEKAAYAFNRIFLFSLLEGMKPGEAFKVGIGNVSSANQESRKICCC